MVLLIPSYYAGWQRADHYYDEKNSYVSCFSLNPDKSCQELYPTFENEFLEMINHLIMNKQGIFNDYDFNQNANSNAENFSNFQSHNVIFSQNNKITSINEISINDQTIYEIKDQILFINGQLTTDPNSIVEELYIIIDDKPILKIDDYNIETTVQENNSVFSSWSTYIMSGYLENGCHSINLVGITEKEKIYSSNQVSICR